MYKLEKCAFILAVVIPFSLFAHAPVNAEGFEWEVVEPNTVGLGNRPGQREIRSGYSTRSSLGVQERDLGTDWYRYR